MGLLTESLSKIGDNTCYLRRLTDGSSERARYDAEGRLSVFTVAGIGFIRMNPDTQQPVALDFPESALTIPFLIDSATVTLETFHTLEDRLEELDPIIYRKLVA